MATHPGGDNGKTILLADDEQAVRNYVICLLHGSGYHFITGVDGQDALEKSRRFTGTINLLLSDVNMPHMNGIELATQIQIERPTIQVVLMSGNGAGLLPLNKGWQFLAKPFTPRVLKSTVQALLPDEEHARQNTSGPDTLENDGGL